MFKNELLFKLIVILFGLSLFIPGVFGGLRIEPNLCPQNYTDYYFEGVCFKCISPKDNSGSDWLVHRYYLEYNREGNTDLFVNDHINGENINAIFELFDAYNANNLISICNTKIGKKIVSDATTNQLQADGITPNLVIVPETANVPYVVFIPHSNERNNSLYILGDAPAKRVYFDKQYFDRKINVSTGKKKVLIDPNRVFSDKGLLKQLNKYHLSKFEQLVASQNITSLTEKIIQEVNEEDKIILALHQNVSLTITDYRNIVSKKDIYINPKMSPHNFVLVNTREFFNLFKNAQINVVLQNNNMIYDDGSFSYESLVLNKPYVNIEVYAGQNDVGKQIMAVFLEGVNSNPQLASIVPELSYT